MILNKYALIAGGIALGLVGGITIGVIEADEIRTMKDVPQQFIMKVAGTDVQKPIISMDEIVSRFEQDGNQVLEIELDREFTRDIYELEVIDTSGREMDIDVDARTGEVINKKLDD